MHFPVYKVKGRMQVMYTLHLMCILFREKKLWLSSMLDLNVEEEGGSNTFQKRIVSSAAAETNVDPSGLCK